MPTLYVNRHDHLLSQSLVQRQAVYAFFVFSLLFLFEIFRKYIGGSDRVLIASEFLVLVFGLYYFLKLHPKNLTLPLLLAFLFLLIGGLSLLINRENIELFFVGVRPIVVPMSMLVVGMYFVDRLGAIKSQQILYRFTIFWLYIIASMIVLQLIFGMNSFFNVGVIGFDGIKIGYYKSDVRGNTDWYRPTAIFASTGKAAKVAFLLALFALYYRFEVRLSYLKLYLLSLLDFIVLGLTGSRSAMLLYLLVFLIFNLKNFALLKFTKRFVPLALIFSGLVVFFNPDLAKLFLLRLVDGVSQASSRFSSNFIEPFDAVFSSYWALGAGLGKFSLGSAIFGGVPLYSVPGVGQAENSFLRIFAETGMIGFLIYMVWVMVMTLPPITRRIYERPTMIKIKYYSVFIFLATVATAMWSMTHDTLGSVTSMSIFFLYLSIFFSRSTITTVKRKQG